MWSLDTPWFDVALILSIFAVGNILFGHFEEHRPKWRRLLKIPLFLCVFVGISVAFGRGWAFFLLALLLLAVLLIHAWWLPRQGVNGWTGEPRERYYELIGYKKKGSGKKAG